MAVDAQCAQVLSVFLSIPGVGDQLGTEKLIPPEAFLKNPAVAKELFSHEPGCTVNYQAIHEKLKVLEPHLKVTSCGPTLMEYFAMLRKERNKWAVAFANCVSQMVMSYYLEQKLYGRSLDKSEREALNANTPETICRESLIAARQKLYDIKSSREFARYVRILEECIKQHKLHLQRKAQTEQVKRALVKRQQAVAKKQALAKKQKTQARKAKKAALASSATAQQADRVQSAFNPDLPDFAQFMTGFATPAIPAAPASVLPEVAKQAQSAPELNITTCAEASKEGPNNVPEACSFGSYDDFAKGLQASIVPKVAEQAQSVPELNITTCGEVAKEGPSYAPGACLSTSFEDFEKELLNGEFGNSLPSYDPTFDPSNESSIDWRMHSVQTTGLPSTIDTEEDERFFRDLFGV